MQNFNMTFSNNKSEVLIHLTQWQYWWWFWFSFLWSLYYLLVARVFRYRTIKFNPRIASTLRPHGKWGDLLTCIIPVGWCLNILINSNYILKMIEWQSESSLFTLRVRAKQWYWIYKLDLRNISDVYSAPRNIGRNRWQSSTFGDLQTAEDYLHIIQIRAHRLWAKTFWDELEKKAIKNNTFKVSTPVEVFKAEFLSNATSIKQLEDLKMYNPYPNKKTFIFYKNYASKNTVVKKQEAQQPHNYNNQTLELFKRRQAILSSKESLGIRKSTIIKSKHTSVKVLKTYKRNKHHLFPHIWLHDGVGIRGIYELPKRDVLIPWKTKLSLFTKYNTYQKNSQLSQKDRIGLLNNGYEFYKNYKVLHKDHKLNKLELRKTLSKDHKRTLWIGSSKTYYPLVYKYEQRVFRDLAAQIGRPIYKKFNWLELETIRKISHIGLRSGYKLEHDHQPYRDFKKTFITKTKINRLPSFKYMSKHNTSEFSTDVMFKYTSLPRRKLSLNQVVDLSFKKYEMSKKSTLLIKHTKISTKNIHTGFKNNLQPMWNFKNRLPKTIKLKLDKSDSRYSGFVFAPRGLNNKTGIKLPKSNLFNKWFEHQESSSVLSDKYSNFSKEFYLKNREKLFSKNMIKLKATQPKVLDKEWFYGIKNNSPKKKLIIRFKTKRNILSSKFYSAPKVIHNQDYIYRTHSARGDNYRTWPVKIKRAAWNKSKHDYFFMKAEKNMKKHIHKDITKFNKTKLTTSMFLNNRFSKSSRDERLIMVNNTNKFKKDVQQHIELSKIKKAGSKPTKPHRFYDDVLESTLGLTTNNGFDSILLMLNRYKESFKRDGSTNDLSKNLLLTYTLDEDQQTLFKDGINKHTVNNKRLPRLKLGTSRNHRILLPITNVKDSTFKKSFKNFFKDLILQSYLGNNTKNFAKADLEEETRILRTNFGKPTPLRVLKFPNTEVFFKDSLINNTNTIELIRFRYNVPTSTYGAKPIRSTVYLTFKQKRYNQRLNIAMKNQEFTNFSSNESSRYSGNPFLKNNAIIEENFGNPTRQYRMVKKAKARLDKTKVSNWNRLLRSRRVLVLPAHVNITVITNSFDVVHSWHIPGLGLKMDCLPGRATHHTLHIDNVGLYYGQCAEICGRYHHHMPIRICALPFEHFLVWWHTFGLPKFLFYKPTEENQTIGYSGVKYLSRKFTW